MNLHYLKKLNFRKSEKSQTETFKIMPRSTKKEKVSQSQRGSQGSKHLSLLKPSPCKHGNKNSNLETPGNIHRHKTWWHQEGKEGRREPRQWHRETLVLGLSEVVALGNRSLTLGAAIAKTTFEILSKHTLASTVCKELHCESLLPPKVDAVFLKPSKRTRSVAGYCDEHSSGWGVGRARFKCTFCHLVTMWP